MCVCVCAVTSSKCRSYGFQCDYLKANGPHLATNDINCSKWLLRLCECESVLLLFAFEVMADLIDSEPIHFVLSLKILKYSKGLQKKEHPSNALAQEEM